MISPNPINTTTEELNKTLPWYVVIKNIKGYRYYYQQRTWREGPHVRCQSIYLGPADGPVPELRTVATLEPFRTPVGTEVANPQPVPNLIAPNAGAPLWLEGEDAFIESLLAEGGTETFQWEPGYSWRSRKKRGFIMSDPEILQLPLRLGVTIRSQVIKGKHGFPCFMPDGVKGWRTETSSGWSDRIDVREGYVISLPDPSKWTGVAGVSAERSYIGTLLHEVVHATGSNLSRADSHEAWTFAERTRLYAREEVIAELSANIIARRLGVERENTKMSHAYIQGWKRRLPKEEREADMALAVDQAKTAADYVLAHHSRGGWNENGSTLLEN